jgi:hypothetical protein
MARQSESPLWDCPHHTRVCAAARNIQTDFPFDKGYIYHIYYPEITKKYAEQESVSSVGFGHYASASRRSKMGSTDVCTHPVG